MSDDTIAVGFVEDNGGTSRLIQAVQSLATSAERMASSEDRAKAATERQGNAARKAASDTGYLSSVMGNASSAGSRFAGVLGTLAAGFTVSTLIKYADTYTTIGNRLKLVTANQNETNAAIQTSFGIAQQTSQSFDAVAGIYGKVSSSLKSMGKDTKEAAGLTTTIAQAVGLVSTSAEAAKAGLFQFQQALDSGVLRGEEFNSVMENTPGLARALAEGLRVPIGALRQMAENGELTVNRLVGALQTAAPKVAQASGQATKTLSDAFTNVQNSIINYIGQANQGAGASAILAQALIGIGNNIGIVMPLLAAFGAALVLTVISTTIANLVALATSFIALATNIAMAALALGTTFLIPLAALAVAVGGAVIVMNKLGISFTDLLSKIPGVSTLMDLWNGAQARAKTATDSLNVSLGAMSGAQGKATDAAKTAAAAKKEDEAAAKKAANAHEVYAAKIKQWAQEAENDRQYQQRMNEGFIQIATSAGSAELRVSEFSAALRQEFTHEAASAAQAAATLAENLYGSGSAASMAASEYNNAADAADRYTSSASRASSASRNIFADYSSGGTDAGTFEVNASKTMGLTFNGETLAKERIFDVGLQAGTRYLNPNNMYGTEKELRQYEAIQKNLDLLQSRFPDLTGAQAYQIAQSPDLMAQYQRLYDQNKMQSQKSNSLYGGRTESTGTAKSGSGLVSYQASPSEYVGSSANGATQEQKSSSVQSVGPTTQIINLSVPMKDTDGLRKTPRQVYRDFAQKLGEAVA